MIIEPQGLDVVQWADAQYFELPTAVALPQLVDPDDWQRWASELVQLDGVRELAPPDPLLFDDWSYWANNFNQALAARA